MAIEFLGSNRFTNHVEQFTIIFGCLHSTVATSVNVSNVEDGDGSFNVVNDFDDFFEASPQFLTTRCLNTDLGWCPILDPWEDWELILVVMPDVVNTLNNAREDVCNLLVGSRATSKVPVVTCVERDVACVDGSRCLQCCLDFGKRSSTLNTIAEKFGIVWSVDVHFEISLVG